MRTIIFGNGATARLLHSYARHSLDIAGFTADDAYVEESTFLGLPLVRFSELEHHFAPADHAVIVAVGFVDMNGLRARRQADLSARGFRLASYVHPSVFRHDGVTIGDNCIILDNVSIHPGCSIGDGTFISSNVNLGHDCEIGRFNWINAGIALAGNCRVGEACFFGVNASAAHGVTIGARNFIGANTLISASTSDDQVWLPEPAQLFRLKSRSFLKFSKLLG